MKLYFLIIGAAVLLISAVNIAVGVASWYYVILSAVFSVAMLFAIDGLIAIAIKLTPDRRYGIDSRYFDVSKRETVFLCTEHLNICCTLTRAKFKAFKTKLLR